MGGQLDAGGPQVRRAALLVVALYLATAGHVGSKNVFFAGNAGPYPVSVVVRPPDVVPGLAEISVRVTDGAGEVERITVRPVRWDAAPEGGAPPPDRALPVPGDPELYSAELWLMTVGAYRIEVTVEGCARDGYRIRARDLGHAGRARHACVDWARCFCCWGDCSSRGR